jgi:hypothetical protein
MSVLESDLSFWIKNELNVLFIGKHGVGKTSLVEQAFNKHGLKWKYFSASTMDPWVDFIGIPKEKKSSDGKEYLDLLPPKDFADDSVEALFFDEFNRSPKKVRNAVMELIQFKSINGRKFSNLKFIWAAINPKSEKEEYDVEELDPAQIDRFHIHIDVDYKPSKEYFDAKYGSGISENAMEWWYSLNEESKNSVSPRRLDYCIDIFNKGGNLRHVLPKHINVKDLIKTLKEGPIKNRIETLIKSKDIKGINKFLSDINNKDVIIKEMVSPKLFDRQVILETFSEHLPDEDISKLMVHSQVREYIVKRIHSTPKFKDVATSIINAKTNKGLAIKLGKLISTGTNFENMKLDTTDDRHKAYLAIKKEYNAGSANDIDTAKLMTSKLEEIVERSQRSVIAYSMIDIKELYSGLIAKTGKTPKYNQLYSKIEDCKL